MTEWEIDWGIREDQKVWARSVAGKTSAWRFVRVSYLNTQGYTVPADKKLNKDYGSAWEMDWENPLNELPKRVMARNIKSPRPVARDWHLVGIQYLRNQRIPLPRLAQYYDSNSSDRGLRPRELQKLPGDKTVDLDTPEIKALSYRKRRNLENRAKGLDGDGYVLIHRSNMSDEDILLANKYRLWQCRSKYKGSKAYLHRLVGARLWGDAIVGMCVRHMNGDKLNNTPENLRLGTRQENTMDHLVAHQKLMQLQSEYEKLLVANERLLSELQQLREEAV